MLQTRLSSCREICVLDILFVIYTMLYLVGHIDGDVFVDLISQHRQFYFVKKQTAKTHLFLVIGI